ncbi:hypothetical protein GCM10009843_38840 [Nocardioides bigeumensis]|uniref:Uncharacterized protein n=1 Tax=Nocardioides bigeumensis TaxID=433657 RepID=A0ABN2YWC8_9ACTN
MVSDHHLRAALSARVESLDPRVEAELEGVLRRAKRRMWVRRTACAFGAAAASVAAVLVTTYGLRSTEGAPEPVDDVPTSASTLVPERGQFLDPAPIDPGRYLVAFQGSGGAYLEVDVPTGWSQDDDMVLTTGVGNAPGTLRIELSGDVQRVSEDPCKGGPLKVGRGAAETAAAFAEMRRLATGPPRAASVGGYDGHLVRLEVPTGIDLASCDGGWLSIYRNASWEKGYSEGGWTDLIWTVDVAGRTLMIDACFGPAATEGQVDELVHMVETASIVTP